MSNPYRYMCGNLTAALHDWQCRTDDDCYADLIARARALLAQEPQPVLNEIVAEMIILLRAEADADDKNNHTHWLSSVDMHYIADLLQRLTSANAGLTAAADSLWADNVSLLDN